MKEEACFGTGFCEGFAGEPEILVFFVVEEFPAFCNDRVCRAKRRCPVIPLVKWFGGIVSAATCQDCQKQNDCSGCSLDAYGNGRMAKSVHYGMDFMNVCISIVGGAKLAFSENIFGYKRIIILVACSLKPF